MTKSIFNALIFMVLPLSAFAGISERSGYRLDSDRLCDGYPQISVSTPEGLCVGLMASKENGLKMPRYATEGRDGIIYISDMGGWAFGKGSVWAYYTTTKSDGSVQQNLVDLFPNKKMTMPNGILMDPEGRVYVGTPTGIVRFAPRNLKTGEFNLDSELEMVVDQFAKSIFRQDEYKGAKEYNALDSKLKNKHPLVQMTANADFSEMYFNVGAPSNDCSRGIKTLNDQGLCVQSESPLASAAVWKVNLSPDKARLVQKAEPFARGLRNSMALAIHPKTQKLYQGENGIDLTDAEKPYEEINLLELGKHYGWPYCHSQGELAPLFVGKMDAKVCSAKYTVPVMFLPAHSAPLGMFFYQGDKIPQLQNKLLISLHGYAKYGHRLISVSATDEGLSKENKTADVVFGWEALPGVRPLGAPTGIVELKDGSVLILDDKNAAVLRLSTGDARRAQDDVGISEQKTFSAQNLKDFEPLLPFVKKNCVMCHTQFGGNTSTEVLKAMQAGMIDFKKPSESPFYTKLKKRQMPPDFVREQLGFHDQDFEKMDAVLEAFIRGL